jgi:adenylosuccinate synthase
MPTELHEATGSRIREVGREYGTTTGRPRRCGWLDLVSVKYTAMISGATAIAVMLFDVLAGLPSLKVCVGYKHGGKLLTHYPSDINVLGAVEPVYQEVPGFSEDIRDCRSAADLPASALAYIRLIEEVVGVPVRIISVGPRRDQTLVR